MTNKKKYNSRFWGEFDQDVKRFRSNYKILEEKYGADVLSKAHAAFRKGDVIGHIKMFFLAIFVVLQFSTYIFCIIEWFSREHLFWEGFKELIWIMIPIINFSYVADWWFVLFAYIISDIIIFFDHFFK